MPAALLRQQGILAGSWLETISQRSLLAFEFSLDILKSRESVALTRRGFNASAIPLISSSERPGIPATRDRHGHPSRRYSENKIL
jgi:hypothetical protein